MALDTNLTPEIVNSFNVYMVLVWGDTGILETVC